ncbi:MAG: NUDIX hydrolase [Bacteroidota bacterium]
MENRLLAINKRILALAHSGLHYGNSPFDLERYQELEQLGYEMMGILADMPTEKVIRLFVTRDAYATPMVDVRAVVVKDEQLLLVQEKTDGKWSLPGGWADVGYSASEVAVKEVKEEAGLTVKAVRLLAVFDKAKHPHPPEMYYVYKMFMLCEALDDTLETGLETSGVGFFSLDELPPLSLNRVLPSQIEHIYQLIQEPKPGAAFD